MPLNANKCCFVINSLNNRLFMWKRFRLQTYLPLRSHFKVQISFFPERVWKFIQRLQSLQNRCNEFSLLWRALSDQSTQTDNQSWPNSLMTQLAFENNFPAHCKQQWFIAMGHHANGSHDKAETHLKKYAL